MKRRLLSVRRMFSRVRCSEASRVSGALIQRCRSASSALTRLAGSVTSSLAMRSFALRRLELVYLGSKAAEFRGAVAERDTRGL